MALIDDAYVMSAKQGDIEAARLLCRFMAEHLANGTPVTDETRQYFIDALRAIGQGADPAAALNLKPARHRPRENEGRDFRIANEIYWRQRDGESTGVLFREIGTREHLSAKRVEQIYYRWMPGFEERARNNREEMDGS
ncbi:hypothetical protein ACWJKU_13200 [Methylocaldum sp. MU1018]